MKQHHYTTTIKWTGNKGTGTNNYTDYKRDYDIIAPNKPTLLGSSDPAFRGDKTRYNPEELLVAALSSCHMLWYLHLCAQAGVVVIEYTDAASGVMVENADGSGQLTSVTLYPCVRVSHPNMLLTAHELHEKANAMCFIARSVNFSVKHQPTIQYE